MYLYFNNQGVLKEIVNDDAIRQGNHNINKIRFFIEGAEPQIVNNVYKAITFITGVRTFIDVNGNQLTTESISLNTEELEIPYNKKRELKFFKYFTKYEMFSITVPDDILNESGTVGCRIQMVSAEGIITLGLIVFNVEITTGGQAIIEPDTAINIAQWNYLISNMLTPEKYVVKYSADATQWDIVPTEGSTKPVTSGGIATAIANALSAVYKLMGTATINDLNSLEKTATMNGYVYNVSNAGTLVNEDQTTVSINADDNVVFIWNEGEWYWDRLGSIFDTSNLVTLNTAQTITETKTFTKPTTFNDSGNATYPFIITPYNNGAKLGTSEVNDIVTIAGYNTFQVRGAILPRVNNNYDLGASGTTWKDLYLSGVIYHSNYNITWDNGIVFKNSSDATMLFIANNGQPWFFGDLIPARISGSYDLGSSSHCFKDLYLIGNITDGVHTVAVADIGKKLYKHTIQTDGGGGADIFILSNRSTAYTLPIDWLSLNTDAIKVLYNGCLVLRIYESGGNYYAQYVNDNNTITSSALGASTIEDTVTVF